MTPVYYISCGGLRGPPCLSSQAQYCVSGLALKGPTAQASLITTCGPCGRCWAGPYMQPELSLLPHFLLCRCLYLSPSTPSPVIFPLVNLPILLAWLKWLLLPESLSQFISSFSPNSRQLKAQSGLTGAPAVTTGRCSRWNSSWKAHGLDFSGSESSSKPLSSLGPSPLRCNEHVIPWETLT